MSSSLFRSLIRRRQSALAANMSHPRLIGSVSPQDGLADKIGDTEVKAHNGDEQTKKIGDTQVNPEKRRLLKFEISLCFDNFRASELYHFLEVLRPKHNAVGASEALYKHLTSPEIVPTLSKVYSLSHTEAAFKGFGDFESFKLLSIVQQYTTDTARSASFDADAGPGVKVVVHPYLKMSKYGYRGRAPLCISGSYIEATANDFDHAEGETTADHIPDLSTADVGGPK